MQPINQGKSVNAAAKESSILEKTENKEGLSAAISSISSNPRAEMQTQVKEVDPIKIKAELLKLREALKKSDVPSIQSLLTENIQLINVRLSIPIENNKSKDINESYRYKTVSAGLYHYLLLRCSINNTQSIEVLSSYGCDIQSTDNHGRTALHIAAINSDEKIMEFFLNKMEVKSVLTASNNKNTALHVAAINGNLICIEAILKYAKSTLTEDNFISFVCAENISRKHFLECMPSGVNVENLHLFISFLLEVFEYDVCINLIKPLLNYSILSHYSKTKDTLLHQAAISRNGHAFVFLYSALEEYANKEGISNKEIEIQVNSLSNNGLSLPQEAILSPYILKYLIQSELNSKIYIKLNVISGNNETALQVAMRMFLKMFSEESKEEERKKLPTLYASIYQLLSGGANCNELTDEFKDHIRSYKSSFKDEDNKILKFIDSESNRNKVLLKYAMHLIRGRCLAGLSNLIQLQPHLSKIEVDIFNSGKLRALDYYLQPNAMNGIAREYLKNALSNNDHHLVSFILKNNNHLIKSTYKFQLQIKDTGLVDEKDEITTVSSSLFSYIYYRFPFISPDMLDVLLKNKVESNLTDSIGCGVLHIGVQKGSSEEILIVLNSLTNASILLRLKNKRTAFHIAAMNGNIPAIMCMFNFCINRLSMEILKAHLNATDINERSFMHYFENNV